MQIPLATAQSFLDAGTRQLRSADAGAGPRSGELYRHLCFAAELARSGRYAGAEQLALEVARSGGTLLPTALDLLARIYAQQGRYLEAESCWQKALSLSPGNLQYRWGLDAILRERGYPASLRFLRAVLLAAFVILALLSGYLAWESLDRRVGQVENTLIEYAGSSERASQASPRRSSGEPDAPPRAREQPKAPASSEARGHHD
jgi:tetratricopeptide (TPR) repeat protein